MTAQKAATTPLMMQNTAQPATWQGTSLYRDTAPRSKNRHLVVFFLEDAMGRPPERRKEVAAD